MLTTLPTALQSIVTDVAAKLGIDMHSASSARGRCYDAALALQSRLSDMEIADEDGFVDVYADCAAVQMWDAPDALSGDEMAAGHWVARVEWNQDVYFVDITAAQFAALGWTGPRVAESADWN
jgi:hypothetical protein